jgi:hypothetical protein
MVFIIAALHALPILWVAWKTYSKGWVWLVAIISAIVAIFTGNPAYTIVDLVTIIVVLWNCLEIIKRRTSKERVPPPQKPHEPQDATGELIWLRLLLVAGALGFIFLNLESSSHTSPQQSKSPFPTQTPMQKSARPDSPTQAPPSIQTTPRAQYLTSPGKERPTIERCLKIVDDLKMAQCLERAK